MVGWYAAWDPRGSARKNKWHRLFHVLRRLPRKGPEASTILEWLRTSERSKRPKFINFFSYLYMVWLVANLNNSSPTSSYVTNVRLNLSAMVQCFSVTIKHHQSAYPQQKTSTEQPNNVGEGPLRLARIEY
jgi:hypothetical protein